MTSACSVFFCSHQWLQRRQLARETEDLDGAHVHVRTEEPEGGAEHGGSTASVACGSSSLTPLLLPLAWGCFPCFSLTQQEEQPWPLASHLDPQLASSSLHGGWQWQEEEESTTEALLSSMLALIFLNIGGPSSPQRTLLEPHKELGP